MRRALKPRILTSLRVDGREGNHPGSWEDLCETSFFPHNLLTKAEADCLGRYKGNKCNLLFGAASFSSLPRCPLVSGAGLVL